MSGAMEQAEALLFERFSHQVETSALPLVFIIASPRTGSTMGYQLLINAFDFYYFPNFVNDHFAACPAVGAALDWVLNPRAPVAYESAHGKTEGPFGPSEASQVFRRWFGGEHPSQTRSCRVLPGKEEHLRLTLRSMHALTGRTLLTKNAWNCFRVAELARIFPRLHFVWLRRDLTACAISDLAARYHRGSPTTWNSATTADCEALQKRPYWEQVVEQQYGYNTSMARDLAAHAAGRYVEVWYEDLCDHAREELLRMESFFAHAALPLRRKTADVPELRRSAGVSVPDEDRARIVRYVLEQQARLAEHRFE